ncbi:MAG: PDZ domain-containing protein [Betaproteobacteria bacterium]|nr:MAG: PDZ domain-containing protein [Betaproteobacteria bacterium]
MIREGRVRRAYLGISAQDLPLLRRVVRHFDLPRESGARVEALTRDSPAALAGIRVGDIIVALDGTAIAGVDDLQRVLTGGRIGDAVRVSVLRRDQRLELPVTPRESQH